MDLLTLYPAYFEALTAYATRMTGSRASGEDVAQEAFMRAFAHADTLMALTDGQQKTWLYTTARRIVIDQQRRLRRAPPMEEAPVWTDDLSRLEVAQVLSQLPEESAEVIRLRYFAGLNSSEIGKLRSISPATVRTRLRAARLKLRTLLKQQED